MNPPDNEKIGDEKIVDEKVVELHPVKAAQSASGFEPEDTGVFSPSAEAEPDVFAIIDKLNAENASLKDRSLRALAESENLRRRAEREVADAKVYGVTGFARDMLTFADNLNRAIDSVAPDALSGADPALKAFVEGIVLTERDFQSRLAKQGIKKLEPQGKKFDPNMHEALFELPDQSVPSGTVVQVMEDGYAIGDRCLRPAKVGVARGGPKLEAAG